MTSSSDMWFAFARTFSMLFLVLALLILAFYLVKKYSNAKGGRGSGNFIKVLCVHHLSPKEKLVLLNVLGDTILIGVTSTNISKISSFDKDIDFSNEEKNSQLNFSDFLSEKLGNSFKSKTNDALEKGKR